jgi:hypothetical protein
VRGGHFGQAVSGPAHGLTPREVALANYLKMTKRQQAYALLALGWSFTYRGGGWIVQLGPACPLVKPESRICVPFMSHR